MIQQCVAEFSGHIFDSDEKIPSLMLTATIMIASVCYLGEFLANGQLTAM